MLASAQPDAPGTGGTPPAAPALPAAAVWTYAALGFPLAMVALPVYVHLPKFYHDAYGLGLSGLGLVLLLTRALDALQDPLLGAWSDRLAARGGSGRVRMLDWSAPVTAAGLLALFNAPATLSPGLLWTWLCAALLLCYFGYSALTISYTALAADLDSDPHQRTRLAGARESLGLVGVMLAAAVPEVLAQKLGLAAGYRWFALLLVPVLLAAAALTRRGSGGRMAQRRAQVAPASPLPRPALRLWAPLGNPLLRRLLGIYLLSGTAAAVPASIVLFYIQDVIARPALTGAFLVAYFLAGALGMPVWIALARRIGKVRAWALSMALAILAFVWAFFLRAGDSGPYLAVCLAAGLSFGADLALPPSLLSDLADRQPGQGQGAWFGLWALTGKLNLALGAGLSLPLLGLLGYVPGGVPPAPAVTALAATYALLPCVLKGAALLALLAQRSRLEAPASLPSP